MKPVCPWVLNPWCKCRVGFDCSRSVTWLCGIGKKLTSNYSLVLRWGLSYILGRDPIGIAKCKGLKNYKVSYYTLELLANNTIKYSVTNTVIYRNFIRPLTIKPQTIKLIVNLLSDWREIGIGILVANRNIKPWEIQEITSKWHLHIGIELVIIVSRCNILGRFLLHVWTDLNVVGTLIITT